jgi:CRP-like cAMP-binding protein
LRGVAVKVHTDVAYCVIKGWIARCALMSTGKRQITGLYLPGDVFVPPAVDCLTDDQLVSVTDGSVSIFSDNGLGSKTLERFASRERELLRALVTSLGRRTAEQRLAHLLCELSVRGVDAGLETDAGVEFSLTQESSLI